MSRPGETGLGEEEGGQQDGRRGLSWVLDPIDGTVNFVYGIPAYAVSVAAQYDGRSVAGAVANVPDGEVSTQPHWATAPRWCGAGVRTALRCSGVEDLSMALVGTGFAYDAGRRGRQAGVLAQMLPSVRDVRAYRLVCARSVHGAPRAGLDAYYEEGVQVWDWAAAALIAAEAGATVWLPPAAGAEHGGRLRAGHRRCPARRASRRRYGSLTAARNPTALLASGGAGWPALP